MVSRSQKMELMHETSKIEEIIQQSQRLFRPVPPADSRFAHYDRPPRPPWPLSYQGQASSAPHRTVKQPLLSEQAHQQSRQLSQNLQSRQQEAQRQYAMRLQAQAQQQHNDEKLTVSEMVAQPPIFHESSDMWQSAQQAAQNHRKAEANTSENAMRMREKQPRGHSPGPGPLSTPRRPYKSYHAPGTIFKTYQGPNERSPQDNKFDFDATLNPVHVVDPINWYGGKADNFAASGTNNNPLKNKIVHADIRVQTVGFDNGYEPTKAKTRSANNNPLKDKIIHADIRVEGIDDHYERMKTKQKVKMSERLIKRRAFVQAKAPVQGIDDHYERMKTKQKVKMSERPIKRRAFVQAKAPVQGKTPIENGTGKSAASTFTSKVEKHRKSIPMFKVLSHVTSFHALSMSSRSVSYTISEDCTKYSTRHRLRALEGGDRRALVKPSKQSHT
jgi:hypothetical protein